MGYGIFGSSTKQTQKTALIKEAKHMSKEERIKHLENLCKQVDPMPDEQQCFILGYMEGVTQMSEKSRKEAASTEE